MQAGGLGVTDLGRPYAQPTAKANYYTQRKQTSLQPQNRAIFSCSLQKYRLSRQL